MTPQQREAAERLADALTSWPAAFSPTDLMLETAALLRELAAEPMQEPVAWIHPLDMNRFGTVTFTRESDEQIPLYAHPPQRLPLTEDFINDIGFQCGLQREDARNPGVEEFARAIEAAQGIGETK